MHIYEDGIAPRFTWDTAALYVYMHIVKPTMSTIYASVKAIYVSKFSSSNTLRVSDDDDDDELYSLASAVWKMRKRKKKTSYYNMLYTCRLVCSNVTRRCRRFDNAITIKLKEEEKKRSSLYALRVRSVSHWTSRKRHNLFHFKDFLLFFFPKNRNRGKNRVDFEYNT